ncbi:heavy-metal-associated domain-containing protein [Arthrobacter sp. STN4]|uniref:heavy-metal-associated domain-containing protein n=1 Tax=Arthrobacter sp. STN4 TaxID=2923276 RepID=UPI00211A815C|nr:heavy-metal-associated domain-containing protein [Arthrobacter sp. STN4]MCQ9164187.1 heavy-metal-associated domain-containing protein [Arthrobacter sp. STN4]
MTPAKEGSCGCGSTAAKTTESADTFGTAYAVEGLTCGHCVQTVETAVWAVAGVDAASITLVPGGTSTLTVSGQSSEEDIRAAVAAAGYTVTES